MNKHLFGGFLITVSMCLFSLMGPFVRYINLNPLIIIFCTSLLSVVVLFIYLLCTRQAGMLRVRTDLSWMMLSALLLFLNVYTYYLAYTTTTMANAVLTHYTAPIFAALLAPLILGERIRRITLISLVISMSGLVLIASSGIEVSRQHLAGILFGVMSGLFYGILILVSKRLTSNYGPVVIVFYQCLCNMVLILPFLGSFQPDFTLLRAGVLTLYTLFVCLLAPFLYLTGLRFVEAQHAGILAYSEPVLVVFLGLLFYGEMPTLQVLLGGLLIVVSGYLILTRGAHSRSQETEDRREE